MKYFLTFDKFITPKFITVLYWLFILFHVVVGIAIMVMPSMNSHPYYYHGGGGFSFTAFLLGLFYIAITLVLTRVICELILIFFRINENLEAIRNKP